jgi:succinate dehydrogenase / fumarate reductase iron-sulfur subunit
MRHFQDGEQILIEPWRAKPFPVIRDLVVDRRAFDRIIAAGGFVTAPTGSAPEANTLLVSKKDTESALDAAACIACGACVAACPNSSASLFTAAKVTHLGLLPQGQPERTRRAVAMVGETDRQGFGSCTWHGECQEACPKAISIDTITRMYRDFRRAVLQPRQGMEFPGKGSRFKGRFPG